MIATTVHHRIINIPSVPCDDATFYRTYWLAVYSTKLPVVNAITGKTIREYVEKKAFSL